MLLLILGLDRPWIPDFLIKSEGGGEGQVFTQYAQNRIAEPYNIRFASKTDLATPQAPNPTNLQKMSL
jgi:hypothetical protein